MAKLKNPLFSLNARNTLAGAISFVRRRKQNIVEKKPVPDDAKSLAQLSWRHMYQKAIALWHALSEAEQLDWESQARRRHMTGFAWFISQALKPNPGLYLPLQGGTMSGDIDMAKNRLLRLPLPTAAQEAASKAYADLFTLLTTFNTHKAAITGVHGVGDSIIDSTFARNTAITTHKDDPFAHIAKTPLRVMENHLLIPVQNGFTTFNITSNQLTVSVIVVPHRIRVDAIAVQITAAGAAGTKARLGIYNAGANLYPGTLLVDAGEVSVATIGIKAILITEWLNKGVYYLAFISNGTPTVVAAWMGTTPLGMVNTDFSSCLGWFWVTTPYNGLLNTFPLGRPISGGHAPILILNPFVYG